MENYSDIIKIYEVDRIMERDKWTKEISFISFPSDWNIQVTPPFAGAVVRFRIKKDHAYVSVYLDCYDRLGYYGEPYWEVYPYGGDVFRCDMADTDSLLKAIQVSIDEVLNQGETPETSVAREVQSELPKADKPNPSYPLNDLP